MRKIIFGVFAFALLGTGLFVSLGSNASAEPDPFSSLREELPDTLPWPVTKVIRSDGETWELDNPAQDREAVIAAVRRADARPRGAANGRSPSGNPNDGSPTPSLTASQAGTTCVFGSGWDVISTFLAEFGTVWVCTNPTVKSALDRFGFIDPVFAEFRQTASHGLHFNTGQVWFHTAFASIDPTDDLVWCASGSGQVFTVPVTFWIDSMCRVY